MNFFRNFFVALFVWATAAHAQILGAGNFDRHGNDFAEVQLRYNVSRIIRKGRNGIRSLGLVAFAMSPQIYGHHSVTPGKVIDLGGKKRPIACPPVQEDESWLARTPVLIR